MRIVKVNAPTHFASFCVAINEPFYFLNGAFYLFQWRDADIAKNYCALNGVRADELPWMNFREIEINTLTDLLCLLTRSIN